MNEYNYYCEECGTKGHVDTDELLDEIECQKCGHMIKVGVV
jgi:DNA-directed RNA polymerase subunit RPC12/RpoP